MADIGTLIDFTGGNVLYANQLDSNFGAIRTVVNNAVVHTDKASQVVTKSLTFTPDSGVGFTVSTGGATITAGTLTLTGGNLVVTAGTVTVSAGATALQALTCTTLAPSGTSTLQDVTCTTLNANGAITGTLAAGAQNNITGLSGLTSAAISGTLTLSNASPLSLAATSKFVVGATSFSIKDSGDGVTAFGLTGTGTATTVALNAGSSGGTIVTGNNNNTLTLSSANASLNASSGMVFLSTDGATPKSNSATTGLAAIPHVAGTPSGSLGSSKIGAIVYSTGDSKLYVWTGSAWKSVTLA